MKPVQRRLRFRRFSTVQLTHCSRVFFIFAPFVEEIKGGELIVSILFSLVLVCCGPCCCGAQTRPGHRDRACHSSDRRQVDQSFSAGPGSTCSLPCCRTRADCFCNRASAALYPARACGYCRSALCEHFGLSDARFDVDDGLLARGPVDARRSLLLQHERRVRDPSNGFSGFYFSFITLSTVGYGDITPVSRLARWLAAMEAMTGLLYVAVLIARLVSLYRSGKEKFHVGNSTPKSVLHSPSVNTEVLWRASRLT